MPATAPDAVLAVHADPSLHGSAFCRALSDSTDRWLADLFEAAVDAERSGLRGPNAMDGLRGPNAMDGLRGPNALDGLRGPNAMDGLRGPNALDGLRGPNAMDGLRGPNAMDGLALVAVGGYGRGELCPGSDLDVVLIDGGKRDRAALGKLAEQIWYPVWDAGVKLGHAVRTPKDALTLAATDIDTATSFLTVRLVAGDEVIAAEVAEKAAKQWRQRSSKWLAALGRSVAERHQRKGEVAFHLEPDLKEGRGGLRDVHALHWAEAAERILLDEDKACISAAYETLLAARVELQRRTGKATDQLLLQEQDAVAAALGDRDADALMARVVAAARTIAWTSDETWQRVDGYLRGPSGRVARRDQPVGAGLVLREGVIELDHGADPAADPTLVLRAAAVAATRETRLARRALDRLATESAPLPEPWPEDARRAWLRLLGAGPAAIPVLEALDQKGIVVRLVPEWARVQSKPQRNAYHRFTVDRHLCEAAALAAGLAARVHRPDLLLIGAWLHDIGKGFPGDHSVSGAEVVERIATRMGFPPADVDTLVTLTRHHLLLADAATRRDVTDPATAEAVAAAVGSAGTLELLHALTEADSLATGPSAWSPWKAGLVTQLVNRTAKTLATGVAPPGGGEEFPGPGHRDLIQAAREAGDLVVRPGQGRFVALAAPDRPGLFSRVAGTLALHGLDVLVARVGASDDGVAVEEFQVEPVFGGETDWAAFEADLRRVLTGRLSLDARLAERSRTYGGLSRPTSATPARTAVTVDNDASATATVLEVHAPDRIGTLYRITRALADLTLDIRHATVASLGHEVVDAFYVVDADGSKLLDPDHCREVERAVIVELSRA